MCSKKVWKIKGSQIFPLLSYLDMGRIEQSIHLRSTHGQPSRHLDLRDALLFHGLRKLKGHNAFYGLFCGFLIRTLFLEEILEGLPSLAFFEFDDERAKHQASYEGGDQDT